MKWDLPPTWTAERIAALPRSAGVSDCHLGCHIPEGDISLATEAGYTAHRHDNSPRCEAAQFGRSMSLKRRRAINKIKKIEEEPYRRWHAMTPLEQRYVMTVVEGEELNAMSRPVAAGDLRRGDHFKWMGFWYRVISSSGHHASKTSISVSQGRSISITSDKIVPAVRASAVEKMERPPRFVG